MPRPGLPLVHFNDTCCGSVAELRSIILKGRRLADDHAEQERTAAAVKTWLLAQIEKKPRAPSADIADTAPDESFVPERLAALRPQPTVARRCSEGTGGSNPACSSGQTVREPSGSAGDFMARVIDPVASEIPSSRVAVLEVRIHLPPAESPCKPDALD
jgi:hypothetical protein